MIIILLYILIELLRNEYIIVGKDRSPNHGINVLLRGIPIIALYFYTSGWNLFTPDWPTFGRYVFTFVAYFWFLFDSILNIVRNESYIAHLGTSPIDLFQKNTLGEGPWFWLKSILFIFATLNFLIDPITGNPR
jgi:hypothetical protein